MWVRTKSDVIDWQHSFGRHFSEEKARWEFSKRAEQQYSPELVSFLQNRILIPQWHKRATAQELADALDKVSTHSGNHDLLAQIRPVLPSSFQFPPPTKDS